MSSAPISSSELHIRRRRWVLRRMSRPSTSLPSYYAVQVPFKIRGARSPSLAGALKAASEEEKSYSDFLYRWSLSSVFEYICWRVMDLIYISALLSRPLLSTSLAETESRPWSLHPESSPGISSPISYNRPSRGFIAPKPIVSISQSFLYIFPIFWNRCGRGKADGYFGYL